MRKPRLISVRALILLAAVAAPLTAARVSARQPLISPPESIVADNVPPIPASLAQTAGRYTDYRAAFDLDWHPQRREMLISTRFGDTFQLHFVSMSESDRIVAALKKQETSVWYIMAKDEGRGYQKKQNQDYQFYATVEFLQQYLLSD
jgi:hypothetical protein